MNFDLDRVIDKGRNRAQNGVRALATALVVGFSALAAASQTYDLTNVGLGGTVGHARAINASGQVAGWGSTADDTAVHAFFASRETGTIDLGTLGGTSSFAERINASGQVIGYSFMPGDATLHAFSWTKAGGMVDLGAMTGGDYSLATGINDLGQVVGFWQTADRMTSHGFLWSPTGGMIDLGTLGGTWTAATSISNFGQVLGISNLVPGDVYNYHAFLWTRSGGMVDLGTLGGASSSPIAINTLGQVVGGSNLADNTTHPFLWTSAGGMIDLGTNGGTDAYAFAITSAGQVLGLSYSYRPSVTRSFSWTAAGGMVDIGTLGGGSTIPAAFDLSGQVVGTSQMADNSGFHAFTWTSAGGLIDLGTLGGSYSSGKGVNALGQVVGYAATAGDASQHAFIYDATGMKDLNDLVPNKPAGMELFDAYLLSDSKAMVGATNVGLVLLSPTSTGPVAPVVGPITANDPVAVGATLSVSANFTDANASDTHIAAWTWGDGSAAQSGTVTESGGSGNAKGSHTFAAAGVYPVSAAVTDNGGLAGSVSRNVVVYDPSAGFVTGNGSIRSPMGAFKADPTVAGNATFSFVSKYQKGARVPVGTTAFQFQSANLDFYSDTYDWMVVAGARAQFKGTGTLDGAADYKFLLTAIDGQVTGGGTDRFRIKIWHYDAALQQDVVDYDNQLDASTEGTLSEGTAIANGSIVIHTPNK